MEGETAWWEGASGDMVMRTHSHGAQRQKEVVKGADRDGQRGRKRESSRRILPRSRPGRAPDSELNLRRRMLFKVRNATQKSERMGSQMALRSGHWGDYWCPQLYQYSDCRGLRDKQVGRK